jgi:hypothetical protein
VSQAAAEEEKWLNERQAAAFASEARFKSKLAKELASLKQRVSSGKAELLAQRQAELQRMLARSRNLAAELNQQHRLERVKYAKATKAGD